LRAERACIADIPERHLCLFEQCQPKTEVISAHKCDASNETELSYR
jgi:hypothetical protein